jgi:AraC-like DNA-binding protein
MSTGELEYHEFPAPPALTDVVRCVWLLSGPATAGGAPQPVVPDGCAEIVLNLADPFRRVRDSGGWEVQPRAMVVGQITGAVVIAPSGVVDLVGVRLQPWGAFSVLATPAAELCDVLVPLDALQAEMARDLPGALADERTPARRAASVFRYVATRTGRAQPTARARAIVDAATAHQESPTVRALATRLGLGERQVERELGRHVGLRPKMLLRIARFQRTLALARADETLRLSAIAARSGYFDQSHLTHEFRRFAACTPTEFLGRDRSLTDLFLSD